MKPTILITAALFAFRAHGTPTTLDFEAPLPGGLVAATHSHLAPAPSSAVITTQYANDGVLFSGVVLLNLGSGHATSGVNALGGLDNQGRFNSGAPITLAFVSPTDGVTPATTDFFSVYTDLLADSDNSVLVSAYDLTGTLLGTATHQEPGQNGSIPIVLSGIGQIHTIIVDATLNDMVNGIGGIQFDLITFNITPVPEPSSGVLLLLGAAFAFWKRQFVQILRAATII